MARTGGGGIIYDKVSVYSNTESLEDIKKVFDSVMEKYGVPKKDVVQQVTQEDVFEDDEEELPVVNEAGGEENDEELADEQSGVADGEPKSTSPWLRRNGPT